MVSEFAGKEVRYDSHGQIMTPKNTIPQPLDLSKFEILKDLYWWYLKQDAYQSIVSGNALLYVRLSLYHRINANALQVGLQPMGELSTTSTARQDGRSVWIL